MFKIKFNSISFSTLHIHIFNSYWKFLIDFYNIRTLKIFLWARVEVYTTSKHLWNRLKTRGNILRRGRIFLVIGFHAKLPVVFLNAWDDHIAWCNVIYYKQTLHQVCNRCISMMKISLYWYSADDVKITCIYT